MKKKYTLWQRYGHIHQLYPTVFELTDEEVEALENCLDDPCEFREVEE